MDELSKFEKQCTECLTGVIKDFFYKKMLEKSRNTMLAYMYDLYSGCRFFSVLIQDRISLEYLQTVTILDFRRFFAAKRQSRCCPTSQQRILTTWKTFFKFINIVTLDYFKPPKTSKRHPRPIPSDIIDKIKNIKPKNWEEARDKALWICMYCMGLRISEAINLKMDDIMSNYIKIFGKGSKERVVPLLPIANKIINMYINMIPNDLRAKNIFILKNGKKMTQQAASQRFKRWRNHHNIQSNITLHSFRHSFATDLLSNGCSIATIKKLLGHENMSTTSQYIKIEDRYLEEAFLKHLSK